MHHSYAIWVRFAVALDIDELAATSEDFLPVATLPRSGGGPTYNILSADTRSGA